ncbi:MAG: RNA polymerase subunit sigma-70, partial [Aldersonia sp.]|nr:RNA polymerase subunit sigma-70 [Aldersonia sp.]
MSAIGTEEREPQLGGPEHDGVELDAAEFDRVARRHRDELQLHCYRMLGTLQDAEDTTQETLLHAWRSREDFAGAASVRTWLFRIATNACLDVIRRRNRHPVVLEPVSHPAGTPDTPVVSAPWVEP